MKILLVGNYPPPFGGISVHVRLLHRLLLDRGIDCQVLNIDPEAGPGQDYFRVSNWADFIFKLVCAGRGRIIHLHTNGHNPKSWMLAVACAWVGQLLGCGSVLTIHSGMAPEYMMRCGRARRLIIKLALAPQSLVVSVNEQIRAALTAFGFNAEKTMLMPAFLFDERELTALGDRLKSRLSNFHPLLSLVAFFRPEYGVKLLIEALDTLARQFPQIGCAIMGSGDGERELRQLAEDYGVADRLLWLGDLDHGECLSVMKFSDLFVRPTLADGDSVSVREAAQLGVPVVASDVGHRPATVSLFRRGDAVDLAAKCAAVLANRTPARQQEPSSFPNEFSFLIDAYSRIFQSPITDCRLPIEKRSAKW